MKTQKALLYRSILIFLSIYFISIQNSSCQSQSNSNFEIAKSIDIYSSLLKQLNLNYVDELNQGKLTKDGIDAMLKDLDPYTVYIPESEVEDYKFITTGQYGGIGSVIQKRGDYVILAEPYEGWPAQKAGLMAGDKILKIDGNSIKGKKVEDISQMLKGQAGTSVTLNILRAGKKSPFDKTLVREKISIDDIPYYTTLKDSIGYIKLTGFTQNAASELRKHFLELNEKENLNGLILDLRGNGGGLLTEAVDIVNIFTPKGQEVVTTKGRTEKETIFRTRMKATDTEIPLVVLINKGSASASEIVSGSIQDLDRGVIIGQRSFGKGLVQNVVPLSYNAKAKITVAKYYIPSGRCIQAIDYSHKDKEGNFEHIPDSLISEFKTKHGRKVYDGGGITPDVKIKPEKFQEIVGYLYAKNFIFDFATQYRIKNENLITPEKFEITDEIYNNFLAFLKEKKFEFKSIDETQLEGLKKDAEKQNYFDDIKDEYQALLSKIEKTKSEGLQRYKDQIKELLRIEIVTRYYYQKGKIISSLKGDKEIDKAISILKNKKEYKNILSGKVKVAEKTN